MKASELRRAALLEKHADQAFGYGIVDHEGLPWWDETCVCQDREPMDDTVETLNRTALDSKDRRAPYRTVRLRWEDA